MGVYIMFIIDYDGLMSRKTIFQLCLLLFKDAGRSNFLLLLFEPLGIAFDTLECKVTNTCEEAAAVFLRGSLRLERD
jgi:hypothetical protein